MKIYLQALRLEGVKVIYIFDYMQPTTQLKLLFTLTALILCRLSPAQNGLTGPEQDCVGAIPIDFAFYSYHCLSNPANNSDSLNINHLKQGQMGSIKLYNTSWALIKQIMGISSPRTTIDIGDLPAGLYYYNIYSTNQQHTGRFIKV